MKLTIGMATYDDALTIPTVQALAMYHPLRDAEIIIVDNNPDSKYGKDNAAFARSCATRKYGPVRYIAMPELGGTTQPRQRIFNEARGEIVLVMDPHVYLAPGAVQKLMEYYDAHPDCMDLLSGPLVYDSLENIETNFSDTWGSGMWGKWEHDPRGDNPNDEPFEIWAMGLGVFSCRRSAWPGFNPHFRGFGGEEGYIHHKFRALGRQTLCLPFLRWWHKFRNPSEPLPYLNTFADRVRNYILGFQELGLPIEPIREHFVENKLIQPELYDFILKDPVNNRITPSAATAMSEKPKLKFTSLQSVADHVASQPRDLDQHAQRLQELANGKRILLFGKRIAWDALLLAGKPMSLTSYNTERDSLRGELKQHAANELILYTERNIDSLYEDATDAGPYDLVILDTIHAAERTAAELAKFHAVTDRILIRSTGAFGEKAEGINAPGMFYAMRQFLAEHPKWFVSEHTDEQYGYTILSRVTEERPTVPVWPWPPGFGPGTELGKILATIGVKDKPSCDCTAKRNQMDRWGVSGCREHRDTILQWMREGSERWGYGERLRAAAAAVVTGLAFHINWADPFPDLIDMAIATEEKRLSDLEIAA